MKYNKKILLGLTILVVIIFIVLIVTTKIESEKRKEEEYNKLVSDLCILAVDLSKTNSNTIGLNKENIGEVAFVPLSTLSLLTMGAKNHIPLNLENPKLSADSKKVYFEKTKAIKLVVDNNKKAICSGLVDIGEGPKITLKGETDIVLKLGEEYVEPGYTATDKEQGDLTSKVLKNGLPNTKVRGDYEIIYYLEDNMGNKTSEIRKISVK